MGTKKGNKIIAFALQKDVDKINFKSIKVLKRNSQELYNYIINESKFVSINFDLFPPLWSPPKSTYSISGTHYSYNKPVLIEFEKGKISKITPVKAGGVPKLFVAPD